MPEKQRIGAVPFAIIICVICSLILATVSSSLKDLQIANKKADMQYNVLKALKIDDLKIANEKGKRTITNEEMAEFFKENISGLVLDNDGKVIESLSPDNLKANDIKKKVTNPLYIYTYNDETGKEHKKYAIHVSGMGLWSTIRGFLALEEDMATISGVAFYEHGETAGLGALVVADWFQENFEGKIVYDTENNEPVHFQVIKGKVDEKYPASNPANEEIRQHIVDGISAATMTCQGVTKFINRDFAIYNNYFRPSEDDSAGKEDGHKDDHKGKEHH